MADPRLAAPSKRARRQRATIVFIDQSGFLLNPLVRRSLAPKGQTPILTVRGRHRQKVSVMAALSLSPRRGRFGLWPGGGYRITDDELAAVVGAAAAYELESALDRIKHCLGKLTDAQVWHRSQPSLNSIGNLILHLCGNLRQWVIAGLGGAPDERNRPAEFAERGSIPNEELVRRLEAVVEEAKRILAGVDARQLTHVRCIQGFDVTGAAAIFDSVPHFRGHTQEIVHMTRLQLGDGYKFAWTPSTPE